MVGGRVDARCCWLERRGLRSGWVGLRCALRHINDDLNLIVRVVWFCRIAARDRAKSFFT